MELWKEEDALFSVSHQVTEQKMLHLEKGVRKLGFQSGGNRILAALFGLGVFTLILGRYLGGIGGQIVAFAGAVCLLFVLAGIYSLAKGWSDAKRQIHLQFSSGKLEGNINWEYYFFENGYEALGKNERSRIRYSHIGRLIDLSGMYVLVEKGNVIRYFMKDDVVKGEPDGLGPFLEEKCGMKMEHVSVRS